MDTRAQGAINISRALLALVGGGIIIWIVNEVTSPLLDHANQAGSDPVATTGTNYLTIGVNQLPLLFLMITFFGTIAYAVYSREVLGR